MIEALKAYEDAEADAGIPDWAISSINTWLISFFQGHGDTTRIFAQEVERNLHHTLSWRKLLPGANEDLWQEMHADKGLLVRVIDFCLRNMEIGYVWHEIENAALELNRYLEESGADWRVRSLVVTANTYPRYTLERRTDAAAEQALALAVAGGAPAGEQLSDAWHASFGEHPNPSEAYRLAVKAIENVAIPVVLPNDRLATLGKVIGELRSTAGDWKSSFSVPVGPATAGRDPVEVMTDLLDLVWRNQTDRHGGTGQAAVPITQGQAELVVQIAVAIVPIFRNGDIARV